MKRDMITLNNFAKILSGRGYHIGQNQLIDKMLHRKWLMYDYEDHLVPQQTEVNSDRMIYETYIADTSYGQELECGRTLITTKGVKYYYEKLTGANYESDLNYNVLPDINDRTVSITMPEGQYNYISMVASAAGQTIEEYILGKIHL